MTLSATESVTFGSDLPRIGVDLDPAPLKDIQKQAKILGITLMEQVLFDVGRDPDVDSGEVVPTPSLAAAVLLLAVSCFKAPDAPYGIAAIFDTGGLYVARDHPSYQRLLVGARETFGVA